MDHLARLRSKKLSANEVGKAIAADTPVTNCDCWDDEQSMEAGTESTGQQAGQQEAIENSSITNGFWNEVKIEAPERLGSSTCYKFLEFKTLTKDWDKQAGAILLSMMDTETGEIQDRWVPKKLCCNMDIEACTIWVWEQYQFKDFNAEVIEAPKAPIKDKE